MIMMINEFRIGFRCINILFDQLDLSRMSIFLPKRKQHECLQAKQSQRLTIRVLIACVESALLSCLTPRVRYTALAAARDGVLVGANRCPLSPLSLHSQLIPLSVLNFVCVLVARSTGLSGGRRLPFAHRARSTPCVSRSLCW